MRCGVLAVAIIAFGLPSLLLAQSNPLDPFVGRDLWTDRPSASDQARLDAFLGIKTTGTIAADTAFPWRIWKRAGSSRSRYIVLMVAPVIWIPGGSAAAIRYYDEKATLFKEWRFPVGWRISPDRAFLDFSPALGTDLLTLEMTRFVNGRYIKREYYSLTDQSVRLVRLENEEGQAVSNVYYMLTYEIGPRPVAASTDEEWARKLESADKPVVLEALTFLGARHFGDFSGAQGKGEFADMVERVLTSERIQQIVAQLSESGNEWIRQAAKLAESPVRKRPIF